MEDVKFDPSESSLQECLNFLTEYRGAHCKTVGPTQFSDIELADKLTSEFGYKPIGEEWNPIMPDQAARLLQMAFSTGLADGLPRLDLVQSVLTANRLACLVDIDARFYTNVNSADSLGILTWTPVSEMAFDCMVLAVDNETGWLIAINEGREDQRVQQNIEF